MMFESVFGQRRSEATYDTLCDVLGAGTSDAMEESEVLDFKLKYPDGSKLADLSRDVCSFANAGGGVILFGVREDQRVGERAGEVTHVPLGGEVTRLQRSVHQLVVPTVPGLDWLTIRNAENSAEGLLALVVPRSPLAPHAVRVSDRLEFHVRKGRETRHMQEGELEAAYRERRRSRRAWAEELDEVLEQVKEVNSSGAITIVAGPIPRARRVYPSPREGVDCMRRLQRSRVLDMGGRFVLGNDVRSRFRRITVPRVPSSSSQASSGDAVVLRDDGVLAISTSLPSLEYLRTCTGWEDVDFGAMHPSLVGYTSQDMLSSRVAMALVGLRETYSAFGIHGDVAGELVIDPGTGVALIDTVPFKDVHGVLDECARFSFEFEIVRLSEPSWIGRFIGEVVVDILGAFDVHWSSPVSDDGEFEWGRLLTTHVGDPIEFWGEKGIKMAPANSQR